ncbi:3-alpha--hydroxysteroid dehydrogenase [Annulohypoxylon truncatum]|uniref:3-alpha--hydroxysteroid dehydrogenase n=1 Tax=Annulohypoxylon truncatum TaxID=327061 RepID=UPI0020089EF7|nr:3-alpha--hydroxysteroid dehydrogenase [Annulohypoxylon truncatum]KAI1204275.1 3-alpha--hydroxysteroid dehydrogenase [Annulohypoxylon truncatum]
MADPKPLKDKVVLVTGAAQGLGEVISKYVAARGAILSLADLQKDKLDEAAERIKALYPDVQILTWAVDITDPKSVEEWVAATKEKFGRVNGCVNNAGIIGKDAGPITDLSLEEWKSVIDVNLTGLFTCLKYQLRAIADDGSIVNMSSVAGLRGSPFYPAYAASKHGVVGLTKVAAAQSAHRGVRVNVVCPAISDTPMWHQLRDQTGDLRVEDFPQLFKRYVTPDEVASMVGYLLCDESKFLTRTAFPVDGGYCG